MKRFFSSKLEVCFFKYMCLWGVRFNCLAALQKTLPKEHLTFNINLYLLYIPTHKKTKFKVYYFSKLNLLQMSYSKLKCFSFLKNMFFQLFQSSTSISLVWVWDTFHFISITTSLNWVWDTPFVDSKTIIQTFQIKSWPI